MDIMESRDDEHPPLHTLPYQRVRLSNLLITFKENFASFCI